MFILKALARHRELTKRYGRRLYLRNVFAVQIGGLRSLSLPGLGKILIRPNESDLDVIHEICVVGSYEIDIFRVRDRVERRYAEILAR